MSETVLLATPNVADAEKSYIELYGPLDISHLETANDDPVDNFFSAKQQRLLVESLYTSWQPDRPYLADANVGVFQSVHLPPLVPDFFLSLDVQPNPNWWAKEGRSYFIWEFGKPPELVIEVVSNLKGDETTRKLRRYAQMGVSYYVVYDPQLAIQEQPLVAYQNIANQYRRKEDAHFEQLGLSLAIWSGEYEHAYGDWLRWYDADGKLIATGAERSAQAISLAFLEKQRAEQAELQLATLRKQLQNLGIDPVL